MEFPHGPPSPADCPPRGPPPDPVCIVLLCGRKGAGKDEAVKVLLKTHASLRPVKFAFADPLKDMAFELMKSFYGPSLPIVRQDLDDPVQKERVFENWSFNGKPLVIRSVLQYLGTEIFRERLDPNIWVKLMVDRIRDHLQKTDCGLIFISDCRYENEVTELQVLLNKLTAPPQFTVPDRGSNCLVRCYSQWKFLTIRVERPEIAGPDTHNLSAHKSETSLANYPVDVTILNNGTLDDFHRRVQRIDLV